MKHLLKSRLIITSICGLLWIAGNLNPAMAASPYVAPDTTIKDFNGVDLGSGIFFRSDALLTIGDPNASGLAWVYSGMAGNDSFDGKIIYYTIDTNAGTLPHYVVSIGNSTTLFYQTCATTTCDSGIDQSATLAKTSTNWVYTTRDGTVYTFDVVRDISTIPSFSNALIGKLLNIQKPDGTRLTLNYVSGCTDYCSVSSVVSNRGFALKYDYGSPKKIYTVNLLAHTCDASATCDAYDNYVTLGSFSTTGLNGYAYAGVSVTDTLGNATWYDSEDVTTYQDGVINGLLYYRTPTGVEGSVVYDGFSRVKSFTSPVGTWNYTYSDVNITQVKAANTRTVTIKDPANATAMTASVNKFYSFAWSRTDPLSRTKSFPHQNYNRPGTTSGTAPGNNYYYMPTGVTLSEGNSSTYAYDSRGNVTTVTYTPKVGSGLSATSISASYPTTCAYPKTCNQPTWTKDAKLNQTDYTYDNNHGGVLTVTLPADQNSVRTRTYNTYVAFDTGNGIIYRLTRAETCGLTAAQLSLTACPALATTSVTLTDYGTSTTAPKTYKSSLPYQVTQTDGASSLSAVTTYAYDNIGNVISVDGPLPGTIDQSFTTYDANRHKIFEIGPIPGGTGSQYRTLVRHTYDGDGHETQTAQGYASSNGSDAVFTSYTRLTYDTAGRLTKSEAIVTGNVVP